MKVMHLELHDGKWWIVKVPDTVTECGPYDTKDEAREDLRGLKRFFRDENDPEEILGPGTAREWRERHARASR